MRNIKNYLIESAFTHPKIYDFEQIKGVKTKLPKNIQKYLFHGIVDGFLMDATSPGDIYGISRENILNLIDIDGITQEMVEDFIRQLEEKGVEFKFEKDSEFLKLGYKNPEE